MKTDKKLNRFIILMSFLSFKYKIFCIQCVKQVLYINFEKLFFIVNKSFFSVILFRQSYLFNKTLSIYKLCIDGSRTFHWHWYDVLIHLSYSLHNTNAFILINLMRKALLSRAMRIKIVSDYCGNKKLNADSW